MLASTLVDLAVALGQQEIGTNPDRRLLLSVAVRAKAAGDSGGAQTYEAYVTNDALFLVSRTGSGCALARQVNLRGGAVIDDLLSEQLEGRPGVPPFALRLTSAVPTDAVPIELSCSDAASSQALARALASAASEDRPDGEDAEFGWVHRCVLRGTLWSAAAAGDVSLLRSLRACAPASRVRGLSELEEDATRWPALDLDAVDDEGAAPLHYAAAAGNAPLVSALLESGARVDVTDGMYDTPLHLALTALAAAASDEAAKEASSVVTALVENGAPLNARNLVEATPLQTAMNAALAANEAVAAAATLHGNGGGEAAVAAAAATRKAAATADALHASVLLLLDRGASPRFADETGREALHCVLTAALPDASLVSALVRAGADANAPLALHARDADDASPEAAAQAGAGGFVVAPIHLACGLGAVWTWLTTASSPDSLLLTRDLVGAALRCEPPRMVVSERLVRTLLDGGAQPNARALPSGETPLHQLLRLLAVLRAPPPPPPQKPLPPDALGVAVAQASASLATLLSAGARVDVVSAAGQTPAALAVALGLRGALESVGAGGSPPMPPPDAAKLTPMLWQAQRRGPPPSGSGGAAAASAGGGPRNRLEALASLPGAGGGAAARRLAHAVDPPPWFAADGRFASSCLICGAAFTLLRRRHHCRHCGVPVCGTCSSRAYPLVLLPRGDSGSNRRERADSDDDAAEVFGLPLARRDANPSGALLLGERVCDGCANRLAAALAERARAAARWQRERDAAETTARNFDTQKSAAAARLPRADRSAASAGAGIGASAGARADDLKASLAVAGARLGERGEKLGRLEDATKSMANKAADFASLSEQLKRKAGGGIFGAFF